MTASASSPEPILAPLLLGLTVVTGLVDAVSYLALGHVFTANMTGNVVFLGFAAAGGKGLSAPRSGTAVVAFLLGAVIGGRMATGLSAGPRHRWTGVAFGAEAALLFAAMALAIEPTRVYAVIALTGLAMGIRNATARRLAVPDLTTTVLTLTMTGLAADSRLAGGNNQGWARRAASVVTMVAGAAVGGWLLRYSVALPLALCSAVSGVCAVAAYYGMRPGGLEPPAS
jgi:uncharacterized membrane protein YoaK (UPF0700 family)